MKRFYFLFLFVILTTTAFCAKVDTVKIFSTCMHKQIKCVVITPEAYFKNKKQHFPVVYLLHGYSDNYAGWVQRAPNVLAAADALSIIVVCPDGGYSSWYFDSPIDSNYRYETFVSSEVPQFMDSNYRTVQSRSARGIAGLSMGGHGAFFLGIKHKDIFGAVSSMSGGVDFTPFPKAWEIAKRLGDYDKNKFLWENNTAMKLVETLQNKDLAISFECGTDDFFIHVNRALHQKLLDLKISHDYTERPGSHNWEYWNNAICYQLLFFKKYFIQK
ncbi:MAG: esterase family protein [Chitinophagaceae bacterium]|jgi:S-formylglutathione hydrolase FrmB|nr:esterase family protein [Chitinophagaceae bacterium]